jgi:hypothetical protein
MVCEESSISRSLIQKIWWWISRKEVKLKFVIEMDETEMDDFFWTTIGWDAEIFAPESMEFVEPKPKKRNKQSKSAGEPKRPAVRKAAKKDSPSRKKV